MAVDKTDADVVLTLDTAMAPDKPVVLKTRS